MIDQLLKEIADLKSEIKSLIARVEALENDKLSQLGKLHSQQKLPDGAIRKGKPKL